jgi:type I restriction enzyme, S subunit
MNFGWKILPFGEVFEDVSGGNKKIPQSTYLPEGNLPVIDQGKSIIAGYVNELDAACKVPIPVIIFGDHTRCFKYINFPFAIGADGIKVLKPRVQSDARYLFYFLRQLNLPDAGYDRHFKYLKRSQIILPPLDEQHRIAAILDKADALREKRRRAIAKLDTLLQSVFLEMFGDPVTNPKKWKRVKLNEILDSIDSGWSPNCLDRSAEKNEWGVLKLGAVTSCNYLENENKALPPGLTPKPELEVKSCDLLFSRKNTYDLVGACAFVFETRSKLMLSDLIFRLRLKDGHVVSPEFLWALLTHPGKRKQVQSLASGSAGSMPNISKSRLMNFQIELPPENLQSKFAAQVRAIQLLSNKLRVTQTCFNSLFFSLQQRAFTDKLFTQKATASAQKTLFADMQQ